MRILMKKLWFIFLCSYLSGCAYLSQADYAQSADIATTAIALSQDDLNEVNPIWGDMNWPVMAVAKLGLVQIVKQTPEPYCTPGLMGLTVAGYGAALWNLGVMAGSGPAAIPVAVALLGWQWEYLVQESSMTCIVKKRLHYVDPEPFSYSGSTCKGWGDARPDFCNDFFQQSEH